MCSTEHPSERDLAPIKAVKSSFCIEKKTFHLANVFRGLCSVINIFMGFGFWNEGKYFKIQLLFINVDVSPGSLLLGQMFSTPYEGNTVGAFETL